MRRILGILGVITFVFLTVLFIKAILPTPPPSTAYVAKNFAKSCHIALLRLITDSADQTLSPELDGKDCTSEALGSYRLSKNTSVNKSTIVLLPDRKHYFITVYAIDGAVITLQSVTDSQSIITTATATGQVTAEVLH